MTTLIVCGAAALGAYAWIAFGALPLGAPVFFVAVAVAAAAYGGALFVMARTTPTRAALIAAALLTIAMRVPLASIPVGGGSDMFRYIWDARAQRAGVSPYVAIPSSPTYAYLHTADTRKMNNVNIPSPYPPGAQLFFRAVTAVHESTIALKIALVACDLAVAVILAIWLRSSGRNPLIALAYAWNPLVVLEVAHSGHLDIAGVLAVTLAAFALSRGRRSIAVIALAAGVAVKFLPLVLAPLFWRRVKVAHALLGAALVGGLYLFFLNLGEIGGDTVPVGSVTNIVRTFRFNGPIFKAIALATAPWMAAVFSVAAGLACAIVMRRSRLRDDPAAWAWPMAVSLACSPLVYPWYLLWLTPFFISTLTAPLVIWTVVILPTYIVWHGLRAGGPWAVPPWLGFIEYSALLLATLWLVRARRLLRLDGGKERHVRAQALENHSE